MSYALMINRERTVLIRFWTDGTTEVCTRPDSNALWGPPTQMHMEGQEPPTTDAGVALAERLVQAHLSAAPSDEKEESRG